MTTEILAARFHLHRRIVENTENFLWLLDTSYHLDPEVVHPLDLPDSRTVQMTSAGNLIVTHSSISRLATFESNLYMGSNKAWISPFAQFSLVNPEKCRRMVRLFLLLYLF